MKIGRRAVKMSLGVSISGVSLLGVCAEYLTSHTHVKHIIKYNKKTQHTHRHIDKVFFRQYIIYIHIHEIPSM